MTLTSQKTPAYIEALTEFDYTPMPKEVVRGSKVNSYPRKRKVKEIVNLSDEIIGLLMPIVYALNKGKSITSKSPEHNSMKEFLNRVNK